jgi:hypothetical protein
VGLLNSAWSEVRTFLSAPARDEKRRKELLAIFQDLSALSEHERDQASRQAGEVQPLLRARVEAYQKASPSERTALRFVIEELAMRRDSYQRRFIACSKAHMINCAFVLKLKESASLPSRAGKALVQDTATLGRLSVRTREQDATHDLLLPEIKSLGLDSATAAPTSSDEEFSNILAEFAGDSANQSAPLSGTDVQQRIASIEQRLRSGA